MRFFRAGGGQCIDPVHPGATEPVCAAFGPTKVRSVENGLRYGAVPVLVQYMAVKSFAYVDGSDLYEQSLDVYYPDTPSASVDPPLVILVVGSGWLGHHAFVYRPFGLQNSAGPRMIADMGCVCLCVRHRGAFIRPPPPTAGILIVACVATLLSIESSMTIFAILVAWSLLARGAATHDEMMDDVAQALAWVRRQHPDVLRITSKTRKLVGGYSSGGHVVASLLQRPDVLTRWGLPRSGGCDGVFYISGVFATRSSSPLPKSTAAFVMTQLVTRGVFGFGSQGANMLPSPLHCSSATWCTLPHLFIHCEHEAFRVSIWEKALSHLLSTTCFAEEARVRGAHVLLLSIQSNHWSILGSAALRSALQRVFLEEGWPAGPVNRVQQRRARSPARVRHM